MSVRLLATYAKGLNGGCCTSWILFFLGLLYVPESDTGLYYLRETFYFYFISSLCSSVAQDLSGPFQLSKSGGICRALFV